MPTTDELAAQMARKTSDELLAILRSAADWTPEALRAAKNELQNRNVDIKPQEPAAVRSPAPIVTQRVTNDADAAIEADFWIQTLSRVVLGLASIALAAFWGFAVFMVHGWSGFGTPPQRSWPEQYDYAPIALFVGMLLSVLLMRRWLFHIVAVAVLPCLAYSIYSIFRIPNPLPALATLYFGFWCMLYYRFVWKGNRGTGAPRT